MNLTAKTPDAVLTDTANGFLAPATINSLFWRPRFVANSPVLVHAPFLFWLAGVKKIQRAAVLGAGDGVAHFLLCQCIDKLAQQGRCYGFDFSKNPREKNAATSIPAALSRHAERFYEDISYLRSMHSVNDALSMPAEASLDAIFIDLDAIPDGQVPHFEECASLLTDQGVLIVHGTNKLQDRKKADTPFFKQFEKLPRLDFSEGSGITVFPVGQNVPPRLSNLLTAAENGVLPPEFESVFRRLGRSIVALEDVRTARACASASSLELKKVQEELEVEKRRNSEIQDGYEARGRKLSNAQSVQFDLQHEAVELRENSMQLSKQVDEATVKIANLTLGTQELEMRLAAAKAELVAVQQARFDETNALTTISENLREQISVTEAERDAERQARFDETTALTIASENLREQISVTEAERDAERQARFDETTALTIVSENLRAQILVTEAERDAERQARFDETTALTIVSENLREQISVTEAERDAERQARFDETTALTIASENLQAQVAATKAERDAERQARFDETTALTKIAEEAGAKLASSNEKRHGEAIDVASISSRPLERRVVKVLCSSEQKFAKYQRDRAKFFLDSKSSAASIYYWLRS